MKRNFNLMAVLLAFLLATTMMPISVIADEEISVEDTYEEETSEIEKGYQFAFDGAILEIYGDFDYSTIEVPDTVMSVSISNANIDNPLSFGNNDLIRYLSFEKCIITTEDIGNFNYLEDIFLSRCTIYDCEFIASAPSTESVSIHECHGKSFDAVGRLPNLKSFVCTDTGLESIDFLKNSDKLEELYLMSTLVTDLSPIENSALQTLNISNSLSIRDLSPVLTLKSLTEFFAENCEMAYTQEVYDYIKQNVEDYDLADDWKEIQQSVKDIAKSIFSVDMSDREIIDTAIRYVIDNMEYNYILCQDTDFLFACAENALSYAVKGDGVCRNYSALTTVLLQEAGIDAYEIGGDGHIWNIIKLNNTFYWLDTTWLDDLSWEEIIASNYYMCDNYLFFDHEPYTVPQSMYDVSIEIPGFVPSPTHEEISKENVQVLQDEPYLSKVIVSITSVITITIIIVIKRKSNRKTDN